jgi:hypothetical protein
MDSAKLNDWLQVIGIFALVASLIFVGLQMQQSQEIARSQIQQARTDATVETVVSTAESAFFVSAQAKFRAGQAESFTPEEHEALLQLALALLYQMENARYQYDRGFLTEDQWQRTLRTLKGMLGGNTPIPVRARYEASPQTWTADFQALVGELILEIDTESQERL